MNTAFDFSIKKTPQSWIDAEAEAPKGENTPLPRKRVVSAIPERHELDLLSAMVGGTAMAGICGTAWYVIETTESSANPWIAVAVGLLIAIAVRLGGGKGNSDARAAITTVFYLVTVFAVIWLVERHRLTHLWGDREIVGGIDRSLVRSRLLDPTSLIAWLLGLLLGVQTSYLTTRKRRR